MKTIRIHTRAILAPAALTIMLLMLGPSNLPALAGDDPNPIPPGYKLIEGDIEIRIDTLVNGTFTTHLWAGGNVPYSFDADVTPEHRQNMLDAMAEWETVANVHFVPHTNEDDNVHIHTSTTKNSSTVGPQGFGFTDEIYIASWGSRFAICHELGHCLGFWHEQSRADRNSYIQINYSNICQNCCDNDSCDYNFDIRPSPGGEYGPYDFDSVMHYGACDFSAWHPCFATDACCRTITVLPPNDVQWQTRIGQLDHLSFWDQRVMSFLYPQSNWRFVYINYTGTQSGTFFAPYQQFTTGAANTPAGGTLWIDPGNYPSIGTYSRPMTLQAPLSGVRLGN